MERSQTSARPPAPRIAALDEKTSLVEEWPVSNVSLLSIVLGAEIPNIEWVHGDDLCDCTFQRIGEWTNPYIGETLRVRFCCIWEDLFKKYPQFVQRIHAYFDGKSFHTGAMRWNVEEAAMPRALWHRQLAHVTGKSLGDIREEFNGQKPPGPVVKLWLPNSAYHR